VDYQLQTLFKSSGVSAQYLRLQVDLKQHPEVDSAMDNTSEKNMRALENAGQTLVASQDAELTAFANLL
jgi:hypothetical protein